MQILCNECNKTVSTEVPNETIIRAWVVCTECIEGRLGGGFGYAGYSGRTSTGYCDCKSRWKAFNELPKRYQNKVIVTSNICPKCNHNYWVFSDAETKLLWDKIASKL